MKLSQLEEEHEITRTVEYKNYILAVKIYNCIYPPLTLGLSTELSDQKLIEIGNIDLDEHTIDIQPENIIKCFKFMCEDSNVDDQYGDIQCICGHDIKTSYLIENIETGKRTTVGSKCIERFYGEQLEEYNKKKKKKKKKKINTKRIYYCIDCEKNIVD
eukprot:109215_1